MYWIEPTRKMQQQAFPPEDLSVNLPSATPVPPSLSWLVFKLVKKKKKVLIE